jgi:DNA (cytosine-5)-methyltransferase 1
MARIRGKDTKPELVVRRLLHGMGYRYRLHRPDLPGRPDLVFPSRQKVIYVHGCFWHQHPGCKLSHVPTTRRGYWAAKFKRNRARDERDLAEVQALGWESLTVWECEVSDGPGLIARLRNFLGSRDATNTPKSGRMSSSCRAGENDRSAGIGGAGGEPAGQCRKATSGPTFIDAFAGCGGLSLGLERAGWRGLFAIEKDPFAFETLRTNFLQENSRFRYAWPDWLPQSPWSVEEILHTHRLEIDGLRGKVDLLAGGPPCQGFSSAGRRRLDDPRNAMVERYLQLINVIEPRFILLENVRGFTLDFKRHGSMTSLPPGNFATEVTQRLSKDYDVQSAVLRASDFSIPQSRPRFILIASRLPYRIPTQFLDGLREARDTILASYALSRVTTAEDAISDLEISRNELVPCGDSKGFQAIGYKEPLTAFQHAMRDGYDGAPSDTRLARHTPGVRERFGEIIELCRAQNRSTKQLSREIRERFGLKKLATRVLDPSKPAPTVTSMPDDLLHYREPRTLTVRENARLQTFPDWFVFCGKYTTGGHLRRREVPRFTQVANAVPPLLAEMIGRLLISFLKPAPSPAQQREILEQQQSVPLRAQRQQHARRGQSLLSPSPSQAKA